MHDIKLTGACAALLALAWMGAPTAAQVRDDSRPAGQYGYPSYQAPPDLLTGTYELDRSRSDDPQRIVDQSLDQLPSADRDAASRRLRMRLDPPDMLSIDQHGDQVSIASSRAPEITLQADGRLHNERGPAGREYATRVSMYGDRLEITATGSNGNDYAVTFAPEPQGDSLRVTRRVFDPDVRTPIVMQSVYRRTSQTADWDISSNARRGGASYGGYDRSNAVAVPDGATIVARLDQPLDLSTARPNDRITLTVQSAPQADLEGATLEGYLLGAPTVSNGRTGVSMDFDTIRLRDGRTGAFDGTVEAIRDANGQSISYNGEPSQSNADQRQQAIERGAVGAAVGALIGAVAGGGKGAAIGAVLGGGGAAATVFIDRPDQSRLPAGTTFTIRSQPPLR